MINHDYAPPEFLHSSMIPLPKGARADLSNSDMYRSIAISSLLSKIFDNVVIERQQDFLSTSNYQFGFKAKSSTVLCTTMVNETIQYYMKMGVKLYIYCYLMHPKLLIRFRMKNYLNCYWLAMYVQNCKTIVLYVYASKMSCQME